MTLVEFLTARLDEDEQVARWAIQYSGLRDRGLAESWEVVRTGEEGRSLLIQTRYEALRSKPVTEFYDAAFHRPLADHIARHDPARVLREVEAKRRLVERYERAVSQSASVSQYIRGQDHGYEEACRDALHDAAAVYSDHPDYREEWRP